MLDEDDSAHLAESDEDNPVPKKHTWQYPRLSSLPTGVARSDRVYALTAFKLHSDHPAEGADDLAPTTDTFTQHTCASERNATMSSCRSDTTINSSAAALAFNKGGTKRSLRMSQLVEALRPRFHRKWKLDDVKREIKLLDAGAVGIAGHVLRSLRSGRSLTREIGAELIQV